MAMFIKKWGTTPRPEGGPPAEHSPCLEGLAAVEEFLTLATWDDGGERKTGTLLLCWSEGRWRGWLHDRETELAAWMSGVTLDELFAALERGIRQDTLEWRSSRPQRRRS